MSEHDMSLMNLYDDDGSLLYCGQTANGIPEGCGTKYFKNGKILMEGIFGDWFITEGREYYKMEF